jgi:hypothetical protein
LKASGEGSANSAGIAGAALRMVLNCMSVISSPLLLEKYQ